MAEATQFRDLMAKIDSMQVAVEQREARMITALEQRDDKIKMLEASLQTISKYIENQIVTTNVNMEESKQKGEFREEVEYVRSKPFTTRSVKLDFPKFNGEEVLQWIYRAEQFFKYYRVTDGERLEIASIHFDGQVVPWYQMLEKEGKVENWPSLVKSLEEVYGPSVFETPEFALFKLIKEDSVTNYYATFVSLANRVEGVSHAAMLKCFISGLRKEIQRDIIPLLPESISKAASLAKLYEDKYPVMPKITTRGIQYTPDINVNQ